MVKIENSGEKQCKITKNWNCKKHIVLFSGLYVWLTHRYYQPHVLLCSGDQPALLTYIPARPGYGGAGAYAACVCVRDRWVQLEQLYKQWFHLAYTYTDHASLPIYLFVHDKPLIIKHRYICSKSKVKRFIHYWKSPITSGDKNFLSARNFTLLQKLSVCDNIFFWDIIVILVKRECFLWLCHRSEEAWRS